MSGPNSLVPPSTNAAGPNVMANGVANHTRDASTTTNVGLANGQDMRPAPPPPTMASSKKGKQKKSADPPNTSQLISQKIAELEQNQKGEKGESDELDRELKKANRELQGQTSKMSDIQKIDLLTKRCSDLLFDMKKHERENLKNKKRADQLQKEKDQSRTELSKTIGLKEKLEKLCRELQKENNKLKNENKTLKDNQMRNQNSWDEKYATLLQKLDDCQEEKDNPRKQVVDVEMDELFRSRFKSLIDQYELRELHFHSLMRTKELEVQYNIARFEREKKKTDAETYRSRQLNEQVQTFSKTEAELRNQLNVYVDKFKQVEDTLNNSNDLFLTFRKEMEDMSKKTKRLEKENEGLKRKHEAMNQNIFKMAEERTKSMRDIDDAKKREDKLKSIITQMQQQGRGISQPVGGSVDNGYPDDGGEVEGEESDYDYEDDDDDASDEAEYGDDDGDLTEDEQHTTPQPFGPVPPPPVTAMH